MPRKQLRSKVKYSKHNYDQIEKAVAAVRNGSLSIRKSAEQFGVAKSTLYDRVSGKVDVLAKSGRKPVLNETVENQIVGNVLKNAEKGFGLSRKQLLTRTGILCKKLKITGFKNETPSKHFWYGLKNRHPELTLRKPEKLGTVRARMLNPIVVDRYFKDLSDVVTKLNLQSNPKQIWNADETGKQLEHSPVNVIARKGAKNVVGRTSNDRSNITIMACVNASGEKMPPMMIVKGKTKKSLFGYNTVDAPTNTVWTYNNKAWMDEQLGEEWFKNVFLLNCGPERPQLLILDGHGSHETLGLLELAEKENIHILALPPHTTHFLQPLDRSVFGPFNKAYNKTCSEFLSQSASNTVNKWTFPGLFRAAWDSAVTSDNILSGFRACGIYPLNKHAVPTSAYLPSTAFNKPLEASEEVATVTLQNNVPVESAVPSTVETTNSITVVADVHPPPKHTVQDSELESAVRSISEQSDAPCFDVVSDLAPNHSPEHSVLHSDLESADRSISEQSDTPCVVSDLTENVSTSSRIDDISVIAHALDTTEASFNDAPSDSRFIHEVDDPSHLLQMINSGEIDIIASANDDGVAEIPSIWNLEIENLFSPQKISKSAASPNPHKSARSLTSHRLLTSTAIIDEKRACLDKKRKLAEEKEERKKKREAKKMEQQKTKMNKKFKNKV